MAHAHILREAFGADADAFFEQFLEMRSFVPGAAGEEIQIRLALIMGDEVINRFCYGLHRGHVYQIEQSSRFANPVFGIMRDPKVYFFFFRHFFLIVLFS